MGQTKGKPAETLAKYYRACAEKGMGAARNTNSLALYLKLSPGQVRSAFAELVQTGRIKMKNRINPFSIDGIEFTGLPRQDDVVAFITDNLRKKFAPVYDPRRVEDPDNVPVGPPKEIVVGGNKLDVGYAYALATILASPVSSMRAA